LGLVSFFKIFNRAKKPITVQLTRAFEGLKVVHDDLLTPTPSNWVDRFDVIRAANILNRGYFQAPQLIMMLQNIFVRLREGGILIVSRTVDGVNHASVLQKEISGFRILDRLGNGSEIDDLIK
jgi:hypothetical protein